MSAIAQFLRRTPAAAFIGDIAKWMRDPRTMRRLMADVRATRTEAAFMRTVPEPTAGARQALVLSMTDWPYQVKTECMLASALRLRGWSVRVLTSHLYTTARRIFSAYGITDLVSFEQLVWDPKTYRKCLAEAARRAEGPLDFNSVKEWTYGDAWIGPQLLAWVARKTFNGAPDPREPGRPRGTSQAVAARVCLCACRRPLFRETTAGPHSRQRAELHSRPVRGRGDCSRHSGRAVHPAVAGRRDGVQAAQSGDASYSRQFGRTRGARAVDARTMDAAAPAGPRRGIPPPLWRCVADSGPQSARNRRRIRGRNSR